MSGSNLADEEPHIHQTTTDKLVYMANQISGFFTSQGREEKAVLGTADHIKSFWDPTMLRGIFAHLDNAGGAGLSPIALKAVQHVRDVKAGAIRAGLERMGEHSGREHGDDAG